MWFIIEQFCIAFIVLIVCTQILLPVLMNKPTWPVIRWRTERREKRALDAIKEHTAFWEELEKDLKEMQAKQPKDNSAQQGEKHESEPKSV